MRSQITRRSRSARAGEKVQQERVSNGEKRYLVGLAGADQSRQFPRQSPPQPTDIGRGLPTTRLSCSHHDQHHDQQPRLLRRLRAKTLLSVIRKRFRNLSYEEQGYAASSIERAASGSSPDFVRLARHAWSWREMLENGTHATLDEIATAEKINSSYVSRILRLIHCSRRISSRQSSTGGSHGG